MKLVKLLGLKRNLPSGFLIFKEERTSPNRVALKSTIPSLVRGIFMVTRRCKKKAKITSLPSQMSKHLSAYYPYRDQFSYSHHLSPPRPNMLTLQASLCGQNFPNPSGGAIRFNNVTISTCLMQPRASGSYSDQTLTYSSR